jgi:hypothetical protein
MAAVALQLRWRSRFRWWAALAAAASMLSGIGAAAAARVARLAAGNVLGGSALAVGSSNGLRLFTGPDLGSAVVGRSLDAAYPSWSQDGTWVAFVALAHPNDTAGNLWLARRDGRDPHEVAGLGGAAGTAGPSAPGHPPGSRGHALFSVVTPPAPSPAKRTAHTTRAASRPGNCCTPPWSPQSRAGHIHTGRVEATRPRLAQDDASGAQCRAVVARPQPDSEGRVHGPREPARSIGGSQPCPWRRSAPAGAGCPLASGPAPRLRAD